MRNGILKKIIVAAVILALLGVGVFLLLNYLLGKNKTYNDYKTVSEVSAAANANAGFMVSDNMMIRYTNDGVSGFDSEAKEIWNVSYEMSNPIADICNGYAAVADLNSQNLYILDASGDVHNIKTEFQIRRVSVADEGITAVWMDDGTKDYITVYKIDGNKVIDMMTTADADGIPVAMEMSEDGSRLVTSYAVYEENKLTNRVTFYNFGELGSNYVDRLVGTKTYSDRLVADLEFKGDVVVAFSDRGFDLYDMELTEEDIASVEVKETIMQAAVGKEYFALVTENDAGEYSVTVYNYKGVKKDAKPLAETYQHLQILNNELIFYSDTSIYITRINGKDKATLTLDTDILAVFTEKKNTRYLIAGENRFSVIELTETGKKEQ